MKISYELDLNTFEAWSGAVGTLDRIREEGKTEALEAILEDLYPDNDSFLILEQKDPQNDKNYWYIQSAIALKGPDQGKYIAGIGFPGETGPVLMERCFEELNDVIQLFETAYDRQPLELSGFENFFD